MAENLVKFVRSTSSAYAGLGSKDSNTLYFTTDKGELYLGTKLISNGASLEAIETAIKTLSGKTDLSLVDMSVETIITNKVGDLTTLKTTSKTTAVAAINELKESIDSLTGGAGSIADQIKAVTGDLESLTTDENETLVEAINEVNEKAAQGIADAAEAKEKAEEMVVTVEHQSQAEEGYAHTYVIKQNGVKVGDSINLPKDLVVKSGRYDADSQEIVLVLNNDTEIKIPAAQLVDVYTEDNAEDAMVEITVDNDENTISADLSDAVKASLTKADSALQASDIKEGATDGTVSVKGTDVKVHGLGTAAYKADTDFDEAGAAEEAQEAAQAYAENLLTWGTIGE